MRRCVWPKKRAYKHYALTATRLLSKLHWMPSPLRPLREAAIFLELSVNAARVRATVGEISLALEKVFGRHQPPVRTIGGVYSVELGGDDDQQQNQILQKLRTEMVAFEKMEGRRPRILVAKMGQDGHDRGQKVIATAFADLGFDVDVGPLFQTPEETARQAVENDVHIVGVSSLAAGHLTLIPQLRAALDAAGREDMMIVAGGVIPPQDYEALREAGASAIFGPGTVIADAALSLLAELKLRLGVSAVCAFSISPASPPTPLPQRRVAPWFSFALHRERGLVFCLVCDPISSLTGAAAGVRRLHFGLFGCR